MARPSRPAQRRSRRSCSTSPPSSRRRWARRRGAAREPRFACARLAVQPWQHAGWVHWLGAVRGAARAIYARSSHQSAHDSLNLVNRSAAAVWHQAAVWAAEGPHRRFQVGAGHHAHGRPAAVSEGVPAAAARRRPLSRGRRSHAGRSVPHARLAWALPPSRCATHKFEPPFNLPPTAFRKPCVRPGTRYLWTWWSA